MKTNSAPFKNIQLAAVCLLLATLSLTGCKHGKGDVDPLAEDTTPVSEPQDRDGLPEIDPSKLFFEKVSNLNPIYFAFDSSALNSAALTDAQAAAELLKTDPTAIVQIEGHCDERGTQEYNLALGERRAQSVRDHLRTLGVSGDRIMTISFGEEAPADSGSSESAWAKNRRCEFSKATVQ